MDTRLRTLTTKLGAKKLSDWKGIGGGGRLTNALIDKIHIYYGLAIHRTTNKSVEEKKKEIWATYFHLMSSDETRSVAYVQLGKTVGLSTIKVRLRVRCIYMVSTITSPVQWVRS